MEFQLEQRQRKQQQPEQYQFGPVCGALSREDRPNPQVVKNLGVFLYITFNGNY